MLRFLILCFIFLVANIAAADEVVLDDRYNGETVQCLEGDNVKIKLPIRPNVGLTWRLVNLNKTYVNEVQQPKIVEDKVLDINRFEKINKTYSQVFDLKSLAKGAIKVELFYERESPVKIEPPIRKYQIILEIK